MNRKGNQTSLERSEFDYERHLDGVLNNFIMI